MEDVLALYTAPADPLRPLVCFDESPYQRISETRVPLPAQPGRVERYDHEYAREGVDNLFMFFAPFQNWREVQVTDRRTKRDFAYCMRDLVDRYFPTAVTIRLVMDQLNTHRLAVLYEVFPPAEAKRPGDYSHLQGRKSSCGKGCTARWVKAATACSTALTPRSST